MYFLNLLNLSIKSLMLETKCVFKLHEVGFLSALHSTHSARSNMHYIIVVGVILKKQHFFVYYFFLAIEFCHDVYFPPSAITLRLFQIKSQDALIYDMCVYYHRWYYC